MTCCSAAGSRSRFAVLQPCYPENVDHFQRKHVSYVNLVLRMHVMVARRFIVASPG